MIETTHDDAIPAATLVVWRDAPAGPRILVVERSERMAFAAGAIVFPGGRIDEGDRILAAALGRPDAGHKVTAIRETLEESGVAAGFGGSIGPALGSELQRVLNDGADFAGLVADRGLTLDLDALTPFARWMPGFKHARKFDTIFYLVRAPEGEWHPFPQPGECVAAEWASPAELVERIERGDASAIFPTKRNLERLAQFGSLEEAIASARAHPVETIIPWIEEVGGEKFVRIPDDIGYPVTSEPLTSAMRA